MSENLENLKFDLVCAHIKSVNPKWSADRVFTEAIKVSGHTGSFCRQSKSGDAVLIAEAKDKALLPSLPPTPAAPAARG